MRHPTKTPVRRPKGTLPAGRPLDLKSRSAVLRAWGPAARQAADSPDVAGPDGGAESEAPKLPPLDARFKRRAGG